MGWIFVLLAAVFETFGVIGLKKYSTTKKIKHAIWLAAGFSGAFYFLYASFDYLQVSTAYAVWIGIGTAAAVIINMMFFGESKSRGRIVAVIVIIIGVSGLKYIS
ncbi:DMT family transporter [Sporosarcina newyorkensis]|uniref:DMT family transporter n=1 Tax=Sporosarcina newyorkensis TaxID=759851 RepID=UPI003D095442